MPIIFINYTVKSLYDHMTVKYLLVCLRDITEMFHFLIFYTQCAQNSKMIHDFAKLYIF